MALGPRDDRSTGAIRLTSHEHPNNPRNIRGPARAPLKSSRPFVDNLRCGWAASRAWPARTICISPLALTVRDRVFARTAETLETYGGANARRVAYLSAEYLPGPHLANNLLSLGITEAAREALHSLGHDLDAIIAEEEEPGPGQRRAGRLASCYMDSLASVEVPAIGYGIRYEFGIFDQVIRDGWQHEITDKWLRSGNPWEIARPEMAYEVKFGGRTEGYTDEAGRFRDALDSGDGGERRRLRHADPGLSRRHLQHPAAVESGGGRVLRFRRVQPRRLLPRGAGQDWPRRTSPRSFIRTTRSRQGKELRLKQQYLFLELFAAGHAPHSRAARRHARDFAREMGRATERHASGRRGGRADAAAGRRALVRLGRSLEGDARHLRLHQSHASARGAGEMGASIFSAQLLPRHLEIIYEINRRFLDEVRAKFPGDEARLARLSLIDESGPRYVRMAHLASGGQSHDQRRGRTALRVAEANRAARFRRAVAGEILQRDQRRHTAALRRAEQSGTHAS